MNVYIERVSGSLTRSCICCSDVPKLMGSSVGYLSSQPTQPGYIQAI